MNFLGYIFGLLKSVIYGCSVFFTSSLTESTDVLDILSLRFLMSFVVLWLLKITKVIKIDVGVKDFFKKNSRSSFIKILLLTAIFEPVLYMLFETLGISMTTNVTAAVILSLQPISSCILEEAFSKDKSTWIQKLFLALGIVGVIYISVMTDTTSGENSIFGIIFIILAVLCGSLFQLFSRKSSGAFNAFEITYISCMLGAAAFNAVNVVRHLIDGSILDYFNPYFNIDNLIGFTFLAIASTIIATAMNNYALSKIKISVMTAFGGVSTIVTILVGVIFNNEHLEYFHYIGLGLIILRMIGVSYISIKEENKKTKQNEEAKVD